MVVKCSISGKSHKQLTGEYFGESIGDAVLIQVLDKWRGRIDENICIEKFDFNMEPVFLPPGTTQYLQPMDVQFFHDYKYLVKKNIYIMEYCKIHQSICGYIDLTIREAIIQIHLLAYRTSSLLPNFDDMPLHVFQKALIKNTDPVYRSVKQASFHITKDI